MNWVVLVYLIILFVAFTPGVLPKNKTYVLWIHAVLFSLVFVSTYGYVTQLFASEQWYEGLSPPPAGVDPSKPPNTQSSDSKKTITFNSSEPDNTTVLKK